jgi:hypothetical protein
MKLFVFVILMIMPDNTYSLDSRLVEVCPDPAKVDHLFTEMLDEGEIKDWGAVCIKFATVKGSI